MITLFKYLLVGAISFVGATLIITNGEPQKETVIVRQIIEKPAPTTTSTTSTTSTTTTTTSTTLPPKPSKSSLMSKVESMYSGVSKRYTEYVIRSGAEKACRDYNAGANRMGAISSLRNYYRDEFSIDDFQLSAAVAEAALMTMCPTNNAYPKGARQLP